MPQSPIRIAILAEDKAGFIKPMAEGLVKMLSAYDGSRLSVDKPKVEATVLYQGLAQLDAEIGRRWSSRLKNIIKSFANLITANKRYVAPVVNQQSQQNFIAALKGYDAVVVVCPLPRAFAKGSLSAIDDIRAQLKVPVVLYQNYFLASRGSWYEKIAAAGGQGLERFDWYLAASTVSEFPLASLEQKLEQKPKQKSTTIKNWPVSTIGHDLRVESLTDGWQANDWAAKSQQPFKVLLDFPRQGFERQRALQKQVLDAMSLPYTELSGRYSIEQIRQLYREHHAFMLSFRESFGLPIVENQLCGNWIFTPRQDWCPSHYLPNESSKSDDDKAFRLGSNFIVCNDEPQLKQRLEKLVDAHQQGYDYQHNAISFSEQYPFLYQGNRAALDEFIERLSNYQISCNSHLEYADLNQFIANC